MDSQSAKAIQVLTGSGSEINSGPPKQPKNSLEMLGAINQALADEIDEKRLLRLRELKGLVELGTCDFKLLLGLFGKYMLKQ